MTTLARKSMRPTRLVMILPHLGVGGAQRVALTLANHWVEQGLDVHVVTTLEHKEDFYELSPLIKREILKKPRRLRAIRSQVIKANWVHVLAAAVQSGPRRNRGLLAIAKARWRSRLSQLRSQFEMRYRAYRVHARAAAAQTPPQDESGQLAIANARWRSGSSRLRAHLAMRYINAGVPSRENTTITAIRDYIDARPPVTALGRFAVLLLRWGLRATRLVETAIRTRDIGLLALGVAILPLALCDLVFHALMDALRTLVKRAVKLVKRAVKLVKRAVKLARRTLRLVYKVGRWLLKLRQSRFWLAKLISRVSGYCLDKRALGGSARLSLHLMRLSMWRVTALRGLLQGLKPDIVLSFLGATNIITIASAKGLPLRLVISERNDPSRQRLNEPWQFLRPLIYPMADVVTANSHGAIEEMRDYCSAGKLAYVPNPVVMPAESSRRRKNAVLFLARLVHQKAPDVLIDAFARFVQTNPGWSLQIAGDGPMERELIERVREHGIAHSVVFHGMVKDPTELLALSRVFVLPSRFEGTPNSLLEAMAAGLACIVTDASPGPLMLIEHGVTGLVVKTNDADGLAVALDRLARDAALRRKLAQAAGERTSHFRLENVAADWERLLFRH